MEIKIVLMIIGSILLLILGTKCILKSLEMQRRSKIKTMETKQQIQQLHDQLDETLELLKQQNETFETCNRVGQTINDKLFK